MTEPASARVKPSASHVARIILVTAGAAGMAALVGIWSRVAFDGSWLTAVVTNALFGAGMALGIQFDRARSRAATAIAFLLIPAFAWGPLLLVVLLAAGYLAGALAGRRLRSSLQFAVIGAAIGIVLCALVFMRFGMLAVAATAAALVLLGSIEAWGERRALRQRLVRAAAYGAITVVLVVTIGLPFALSVMVTKAGTRRDERNRTDNPASLGAQFEDVSYPSTSGISISGWYMPNPASDVTIVMAHGLFRSRYELIERAVDFWKLGYTVLVFDLRRHGGSTGEFCTLGYEERHDVRASVAYASSRAPNGRIVLFGVSMGAAATILAAAELDGISAVVADSSFLSMRHTVYHHVGLTPLPSFPFAPVLLWATALRMNYSPSDFDVLAAVHKVECPILFIGGDKDIRMPIDTVLNPLFEAAPNPGKQRLVVEGATHGHAYDTSPKEYVSAVDSFIRSSA